MLQTNVPSGVRHLVAQLRSSSSLVTDSQYDEYLTAIKALRLVPSEWVLRALFLCLRDTESGEVQYELIEACEAYEPRLYTQVMVRLARIVSHRAPFWFRLMFQSAVNDEVTREHLVRAVASSSPRQRQAVADLAVVLASEYPDDNRYIAFREDVRETRGSAA
jgi:hypothetical protein